MLHGQLGVYRIHSRLGQGGMGTVYRAWHTRLKRVVALKTLRADYMNNAPAVARFHREMEAVGKLDHPNLIRATDAGEDRGIYFLAMEYVEGVDATRLSQACGPLPLADACELIRQAAVGLQCAHEHGLVHRDIKPSNLMVTPAGRVKVLDLGLALLHAAAGEPSELTGSNQWMGTADYMAPEQGLNAHAVDVRADVYSLGCTLYKLLVGQAPFGSSNYDTPFKKMDAHAHQPVPPLRSRRPEVPAELGAVIDRLMAKAPADRFATPGEVAEALAPFTAGADLARRVAEAGAVPRVEDVPAEVPPGVETGPFGPLTPVLVSPGPSPLPPPPASPPRRRRWWVALAVLAVAGLAAALLPSLLSSLRHHSGGSPPDSSREPAVGVWHNLLDRPPEPLLWPPGEVPPSFEKERQRLHVSCESYGLIRLGTAPPRTAYKVQIGFRQPQWTGGVGVFVGYAKGPQHQGGISFQHIVLKPPPPGGRFSLVRSTVVLSPDAPLRPSFSDLYTEEVGKLGPREYVLEAEVDKSGVLGEVRWDGKTLDVLTGLGPPQAPTPTVSAGDFGLAVLRGSAVVTTARWLIHSKE